MTGDGYAIQMDGEGQARRVTKALRAGYVGVSCPGHPAVDWDQAGEARVDQLARQLAARPAIKCTGAQLLVRDQYARDPRYHSRLPAAYSECAGPAGIPIFIAAFNRGGAVQPEDFVSVEAQLLCGSAHGVAGVRGPDFALVVGNVKIAALAAAATGGTVLPPAC